VSACSKLSLLLSAIMIVMIQCKCFMLSCAVMSSLNIISVLITNTLWLMILTSYLYVTFLGYTTLPSSNNTMAILAAILPLGIVYIIFIPLKLNAADIFGHILAGRCHESFDRIFNI